MPTAFEIRECSNPECGLRYPAAREGPSLGRCPRCLGRTEVVIKHLASPADGQARKRSGKLRQVDVLLDNVRSALNVGSILRTAEGLGVRRVYLGGITPTPEIASVRKTSLGAEHSLSWSFHPNGLNLTRVLKLRGYRISVLENLAASEPLGASPMARKRSCPLLLVVGSEVTGVDPAILELADDLVRIPMWGQKASLNVAAAFAIAAYVLIPR